MRFLASRYRLIMRFLPFYIGGMTMTLPIYSQKSVSENFKKKKNTKQKDNVTQWSLFASTVTVLIGSGIGYANYHKQTSSQELSPQLSPEPPISNIPYKTKGEKWRIQDRATIQKELKGSQNASNILKIFDETHAITNLTKYTSFIKENKKHSITLHNYFANNDPESNREDGIDHWFKDDLIEELKSDIRTRPIQLNGIQFYTRMAFFNGLQNLNLGHSPKTERRIIVLSSHGVYSRFLSIICLIYHRFELDITVSPWNAASLEVQKSCSVTTNAKDTWEVTYSFNSNIWKNISNEEKIAKIKIKIHFSSENLDKATCTWEVVPEIVISRSTAI